MLALLLLVGFALALYAATPLPMAYYRKHEDTVDYTPGADSLAGDVIQLADGRAAILKTDIPNGIAGSAYIEGQFDATCGSGVTFVDGEVVWWDHTNHTAINAGSAAAGDFPLGPCEGGKAGSGLLVRVLLNKSVRAASADLGAITDSTGGTKSLTFAAITAGAGYAQADMVAVKNAISQIAATLNAMRTAEMNNRISKGSA